MRGLDDVLKTLSQLKDDLDDDFKWLEAVRKIRDLRDDFSLTSATTVHELFDLCAQITREYPMDDVLKIRNQIFGPAVGLIKTILDRQTSYIPDREEAEQTAYQILLERLERGRTQLTQNYISFIVMEAIHGERRNYKQVLARCRRQAEREIEQHRAEYERICNEINQEPTDAGFEKHIEEWCSGLASDILNYPERLGPDEEEGEIDYPAPEPPDDLEESELENFHTKVEDAFMSVPGVPPGRLIHIFYQVDVLGKNQKDVASEIGYHESTVSRDLNLIEETIEQIKKDNKYNFDEMQGYFPWLRYCLPSRICFAHPNDLKYLIKCVKRMDGGEVMWKVYDWFRKNWCLMQNNKYLHININERWFMDVEIDIDNESAEITRVTLQRKFRREE